MKAILMAAAMVLAACGGTEDDSTDKVGEMPGDETLALPDGAEDLFIITGNAVVCLSTATPPNVVTEPLEPAEPPFTLGRCTWSCVAVGGAPPATLAITFVRNTPAHLWRPVEITTTSEVCP
jgi:hypothetical protein